MPLCFCPSISRAISSFCAIYRGKFFGRLGRAVAGVLVRVICVWKAVVKERAI